MSHELPPRQHLRDRRRVAALNTDAPYDSLANSVAATPTSQSVPACMLSPMRRHNLWIAQLTPRDRIAQAGVIVVLFVGAAMSLSRGGAIPGGRTLGLVAFLVCTLLLLTCLVAFSRWGGRVGRRGRRKR